MKTRVSLREFKYQPTEAPKLFQTMIHMHPELFYVSGMYSYTRIFINGSWYLDEIVVHWGKMVFDEETGAGTGREETYSDEQVLEMRQKFLSKAQWYLDKVDDSMSDYEKALVLHDAIILNSSYLISEEIYELMVNGRGKCYGYSEVYSYLLAQAGVNSEIVLSNEMDHQWNKVEIDGKYYHVDITWDDPTPDRLGFASHDCFLLSDSKIESLDDPHYNYVTDFPSDDTGFDELSFHRINTGFCYVNGDVYVVDNSRSGKMLAKYRVADDSYDMVRSFAGEYWDAGDGYVWMKMYMSLDMQDGYLYMNTEKKIYVYDALSGEMSEFADNTFGQAFYGLQVIDGKVYAVLADGPQSTGTLQYVGDCLVRVQPTTEPATEEHTTLEPVTSAPSTEETEATEPTTEETEATEPTTEEPATLEPTTLEPTTLEPSTDEPTTEPVPEPVIGDLNGDGKVTIKDITILQRFLAEFDEFTDEQYKLADMNRDGKVNVRDVTAMQRIVAEFI